MIAGVAPLSPGYAQVLIAPVPGGGLTWARGALQTPHGRIATEWHLRDDGRFDLVAELPDGVGATVVLPDGSRMAAGAGRHEFSSQIGGE